MTTPALRALRTRFPQAEITFLCEAPFSPILRPSPDVQVLLGVDPAADLRRRLRLARNLRRRRFDLALDFEGSIWTALLAAASGATRRIGFGAARLPLAYTDRVATRGRGAGYAAAEKLLLLEPLGIDLRGANPRPLLETSARARDWARRTLDAAGIASADLLLTVAPGARAADFCWPLESYARLLDLLASTHAFAVVLFPWAGDKGLGSELARLTSLPLFQLDVTPSLAQMAALLDRSDLHVGNENAAKHIASALGTATLTFYAAGMRRRWGLPGDPLQAGLEPDAREAAAGTGSGSPAIARIAPERAHAAVTALEAYLPRLHAARLSGARGFSGVRPPGFAGDDRGGLPAEQSQERTRESVSRRIGNGRA
jgi:ADP-heptose:LPS heptosyltransferase